MKPVFGKYLIVATCLASGAAHAVTAWTEKVLANLGPYSSKAVGSLPYSPLIMDAKGNLYGTTSAGGKYGHGTVFTLTPPSAGTTAWKDTVIFSFNGTINGNYPTSGLVMDAMGNLYGTTQMGGPDGFGVAFRLTPPASGTTWTETTILRFNGKNGQSPTNSAMILDSQGNLYGTTESGGTSGHGTVFELSSKASGTWTETLLCSFTGTNGEGPAARLTFDTKGNLYGTTQYGGSSGTGYGVVFKLTKPAAGKKAWTESVIATFTGTGGNGANPLAGVVFDNSGNLYGTTQYGGGEPGVSIGNGVVYKLAPPNAGTQSWTPSVLLNLNETSGINSGADPVFDKQGNLYVTTAGGGTSDGGTVIKLTKPASASGNWTPTVLHSFSAATGQNPAAGAIFDAKLLTLYGTTATGGKERRRRSLQAGALAPAN